MNQSVSCSNAQCTIAETGHCFKNEDPIANCFDYSVILIEKKKQIKNKKENSDKFWSGDYLRQDDIQQISKASSPLIIGIIGTAKAGKTTYLGMLYTLFLNGRFLRDFKFAGSKTILAWEKLSYALRFHKGEVLFPEATPSNPDFYSIYHLKLKNNDSFLKDLLFADASGEVFSQWGVKKDDDNAGSARWIHEKSNAFILFIDCMALRDKRAEAKEYILDIAHRLKEGLNNRYVAIVWAKADIIEEVRVNLKMSLKEELSKIFGNSYREFEISNYSIDDPDPKCHENNLEVCNWLIDVLDKPSGIDLSFENNGKSEDLFLNYRK